MDGKSIRNKLIGTEDERAVSPVIGVILMVAITVILAAVIAAFVLDLGQGQSANAQAGISFDHDSSAGTVTVTVNSVERADELSLKCADSSDTAPSESIDASAGSSATVDYDSSGECSSSDIQVIGTLDGSDNVITSYSEHY
ncbi:type IV pilin [Natrinema thermotolerans]